jgi:hypothetical protein
MARLAMVLAVATGGCGGEIVGNEPRGARDAGDGSRRFPGDATLDSSNDGANQFDTESGLPPCNGGACPSPVDVSGFQPMWDPPTGAHQNACSQALIDEYYDDCLSTSGNQMCTSFGAGADPAHQACLACLSSNAGSPELGPLVYFPDNVVETNLSGCIALLDPSAISCAEALQAEDQCEHAACDPVCGGGASDSTFDQWDTCTAAANTCGCQTYFAEADCAKALVSGNSPAAPCLVGQDFQDFYYQVAAVFCGP